MRISNLILLFAFYLTLVVAPLHPVQAQEINPYPRAVIKTERVLEWTFKQDAQGWRAAHDSTAAAAGGVLHIESSGEDPYLFGPAIQIEGPVIARLRMKCAAGGNGQIFWATTPDSNFDEERSQHFHLIHDSQWHDYDVNLAATGTISRLRLDPAEGAGTIDVESFQMVRQTLHPLEMQSVHTDNASITVRLQNHSGETLSFTAGGKAYKLDPNAIGEFTQTVPGNKPFRTQDIVIESAGLPALHRTVAIVDTTAPSDWISLRSGDLRLRAAPDGSGAFLDLAGAPVAAISPLISRDGVVPKLKLSHNAGETLLWSAKGSWVKLSLHDGAVAATVHSDGPCEGPVLRAFGPLVQGLFPGLEYLAQGEHSSSTLDIETDEHIRFAPDPMKVTMPLMAFVTDRATAAMTWSDMTLQPVFATPNFLDGPEGHRASLRGTNIECTILIRRPAPMEDAILWAAQRHELPPLPPPPRSEREEMDLCLTALSGPPLKTADGWGHCAEPSWARQPYADQASTVWRLSGKIPDLPRLVPGGSHIVNDAIYFLTGRVNEWLTIRETGALAIIGQQKPDGSFRYDGKLRRGHFEDTASGYCAAFAFQLLDHAWLTGDPASLQAGIKAIEFMKHFRDPRGAQTWECPLHTPDILASAYLVHAYVRGFQLTGNQDYLDRARAWAITGLPFVYQWSVKPVMAYATIAVFGATGWRAPNWMGLPVQWCGYDYACALTMLAPLDHSFDWKKVATGIFRAAEQMQYPSGEFAGCEPDSFVLANQHRNGPAINPSAIVSLLLVLDGQLDSLALATNGKHRIVAPFPVVINGDQARITARKGAAYQAVVDGERIVQINSEGDDVVSLEAK